MYYRNSSKGIVLCFENSNTVLYGHEIRDDFIEDYGEECIKSLPWIELD